MTNESASFESHDSVREIYSLLGEFFVEFQFLCFSIRSGISMIVDVEGQTHSGIASLLTTGMTASPLLSAFRSIAQEMHSLNDFESLVLSKTYKRANQLIERRNELMHATWLTIKRDGVDIFGPTIRASYSKHTKSGVTFSSIISEPDEFRILIKECIEVQGLVFQIATSLMNELDFGACFTENSDGIISLRNEDMPETAANIGSD
jgi:hypothetical protein